MATDPPADDPGAAREPAKPETVTCPVCAREVPPSQAFCPTCLSLLDAACENCGQPLRVRRVRVRVSSAVRLTLEILGGVIIVFTLASIVGPLIGIAIILIAERFGYRREVHHYCPACKKLHQTYGAPPP